MNFSFFFSFLLHVRDWATKVRQAHVEKDQSVCVDMSDYAQHLSLYANDVCASGRVYVPCIYLHAR